MVREKCTTFEYGSVPGLNRQRRDISYDFRTGLEYDKQNANGAANALQQ